ncbi:hypothetical protein B296_00050421 [Ensete ventricosum]|uniref:Uncharacterized protein n=1 Tax=Ensete ventricosum TaxID=4639 RepID=A0A426XKY0_ENSVE|nr:hypothetical protein B296_00050421 [Ensete ventricosum]
MGQGLSRPETCLWLASTCAGGRPDITLRSGFQMARERTLIMTTKKHPIEKASCDPTEKHPTKGGGKPSAKRKNQMSRKAEKGTSS